MGERSGVTRYLKPTIAVGSRYRKTREEPAHPSPLNLERIFYLDLLRTMTIRKLSSLLPRGIPTLPAAHFYPLSTLFLLTSQDSPIDEPRRKEELSARTNRRMRIR